MSGPAGELQHPAWWPATEAPARAGGTTVVYRGWLRYANGAEGEEFLAVPSARRSAAEDLYEDCDEDKILSAAIARDIEEYGPFLSVRVWTANQEMEGDAIKEVYLRHVFGVGKSEAKYQPCYSEDTGHLYTTDKIEVGGHNLLRELESQVGRFAHLEITYHRGGP